MGASKVNRILGYQVLYLGAEKVQPMGRKGCMPRYWGCGKSSGRAPLTPEGFSLKQFSPQSGLYLLECGLS